MEIFAGSNYSIYFAKQSLCSWEVNRHTVHAMHWPRVHGPAASAASCMLAGCRGPEIWY